jgi:hypothetical protein
MFRDKKFRHRRNKFCMIAFHSTLRETIFLLFFLVPKILDGLVLIVDVKHVHLLQAL